jgi:hypothetical protein
LYILWAAYSVGSEQEWASEADSPTDRDFEEHTRDELGELTSDELASPGFSAPRRPTRGGSPASCAPFFALDLKS